MCLCREDEQHYLLQHKQARRDDERPVELEAAGGQEQAAGGQRRDLTCSQRCSHGTELLLLRHTARSQYMCQQPAQQHPCTGRPHPLLRTPRWRMPSISPAANSSTHSAVRGAT